MGWIHDIILAANATKRRPSWSLIPLLARATTPPKTSERPPSGPKRLLGDLKTLGFLFESLELRDLRIYAQTHKASVWHFRDSHGN